MISQPQISYILPPAVTPTVFGFAPRHPQNFCVYRSARMHANLSTSGAVREQVTEAIDILISFDLLHLIIDDDMPAWERFVGFALTGATFTFFPNASMADAYHCVWEAGDWKPARVAPKMYKVTGITFRCLNDGSQPGDPAAVLRRFYGETS